MFYIVKVGKKYLKVTNDMKIKLVKDTTNCSWWSKKRDLNTWISFIEKNHPNYKIKKAKLTPID